MMNPHIPLPRAWLRSTLDALIILEAARRESIFVFRTVPSPEERSALVFHGSIVVWAYKKQPQERRWLDGRHWSQSRKAKGYLAYRERVDRPRLSRAPISHPDQARYNDVFSAHTRHGKYKHNSLIKWTMSVVLDGCNYMVINYFEPWSQVDLGKYGVLPELSTLPMWSDLTYDINKDLLRPRIEYSQKPPVTRTLILPSNNGIKEKKIIYCGEHGASLKVQRHHLENARWYWAPLVPTLLPPVGDPSPPAPPPSIVSIASYDYPGPALCTSSSYGVSWERNPLFFPMKWRGSSGRKQASSVREMLR